VSRYQKGKTNLVLLKQETVSGSGIITQFFTGRMPFLPPNQQRQSTEGKQVRSIQISHSRCVYELGLAAQATGLNADTVSVIS